MSLGPPPVAGILLAAGLSSRMGRNKLLLELDGESVLKRAARRALGAGLSPLVVVLGHEAERTAAELAGLPCRTVINPNPERGMHSSLKLGLAALPEAVPAAVVVLADMPFVTTEMIAALAARHRETAAPLVVSEYEGVHAPPTLYDRRLFSDLLAVPDEGCGREMVKRHRDTAEVLAWPASALADLDVPDDYVRVRGEGSDSGARQD
jgi:molybdenum cofactor cytidylyltransferase